MLSMLETEKVLQFGREGSRHAWRRKRLTVIIKFGINEILCEKAYSIAQQNIIKSINDDYVETQEETRGKKE